MNQLDKFDISIRHKDDKVTASVPQLGLYATASDIHSALDALERKKAALLEDLTAAGEIDNLSAAPTADPVPPAASYGLARFVLKVGPNSKIRGLLGRRPYRSTSKAAALNSGRKSRKVSISSRTRRAKCPRKSDRRSWPIFGPSESDGGRS